MFVRADGLKVGDMVCVGSLLPMDEQEIYRILGFSFGDGNLRRENNRFTLTVNADELEIIKSTLRHMGFNYRVDKKGERNSFNVEVFGLGEKLANLGYPRGKKTEQSLEFPNMPEEAEAAFLCGLFGAEGIPPYLRKRQSRYSSFYVDGGIILSMNIINETYLNDFFAKVSSLLTKYGIQHRIIKRKGWTRKSGIQTINFRSYQW